MYRLGLALSEFTGHGKIVVGMDARTSSEMLARSFTAGALAGGSEVVELGLVPSPCLAFATRALGASAGAIITASHNPPPDNGIAFYHADGSEFTLEDNLAIEELVLDREPSKASWDNIKKTSQVGVIPRYLEAIASKIRLGGRKPKVVVDCANGAASHVTPLLLRRLGCRVLTLNCHPDGFFPGRPPEPQPWNLGDLMKVVRAVGADLGIAHDGDADRVAIVDENGGFIKHDALIALFAEQAVRRSRGGVVVTSVNTSKAIEEVVARAGGTTVRVPLGRFTEEMRKLNACFAGEPGKLVFLEHGPWADGIFTAAKVVELVSREAKSVSQIFAERVPDYPFYQEDLRCPHERKAAFMEHMRAHMLRAFTDVSRTIDVDGLRLEFADGSWVLARVSGTEPKARVVVEASSPERLSELKRLVVEEARRFLAA
jgi:phosphoglucosamine mutase